jgi:hypothetical protein
MSILSPLRSSSFLLWHRLYTHALLLESQIFPSIELTDDTPRYIPTGFTDIWKGKFNGQSVCVKAIRTWDLHYLKAIENV